MKLSIADVSPVPLHGTASTALANTVDLCTRADQLGYHRYWVAEHHGDGAVVGGCAPEVMIAHLAAVTDRIRVGSGAILVNHANPLRVAENFRALSALHPGRIDLGLGRADSVVPFVDLALAADRAAGAERAEDPPDPLAAMTGWLEHEERVGEIIAWLEDGFAERHPFSTIVLPGDGRDLQSWVLGASDSSALLAARLGMRYCYGAFINPRGVIRAMRIYRDAFRDGAGGCGSTAHAMLAVNVCCADTDAAADRLRASAELFHRRATAGAARAPLADPDVAIAELGGRPAPTVPGSEPWPVSLSGGPQRVVDMISEMATKTSADEVVLQDLIAVHTDRCRSYELIAEAFDLAGSSLSVGR